MPPKLNLIKYFILSISLVTTTACSMSGSITSLDETAASKASIPTQEYIAAEVIKTTAGTPNYVINGVFKELSEVQVTSSSYQIQGVFQ